jgi:methionyl-tRNA formyltransferase
MKMTVENRSTRGKTCPIATLSTTNPTWTHPGLNPGLRGGRPATNCLSHGTAMNSVTPHGNSHACVMR